MSGGVRERHLVTHAEQRNAGDELRQRARGGERGGSHRSALTRGEGGLLQESQLFGTTDKQGDQRAGLAERDPVSQRQGPFQQDPAADRDRSTEVIKAGTERADPSLQGLQNALFFFF